MTQTIILLLYQTRDSKKIEHIFIIFKRSIQNGCLSKRLILKYNYKMYIKILRNIGKDANSTLHTMMLL